MRLDSFGTVVPELGAWKDVIHLENACEMSHKHFSLQRIDKDIVLKSVAKAGKKKKKRTKRNRCQRVIGKNFGPNCSCFVLIGSFVLLEFYFIPNSMKTISALTR